MADTDRIKRNLSKMIAAQAPETDLDAYLLTEGFKSPEDWRAAAAEPQRAPGEVVPRIVGQGIQNATDAVVNTLGAIPDLYNNLIGKPFAKMVTGNEQSGGALPGAETLRVAQDALASVPGHLGITTPGAPVRYDAETRDEKIAAGVGKGVGTVASMALPAAAVANSARAGSVTQRVADMLASQPGTQLASGAIGGAVEGATDNPWLGMAAGVATPVGIAAGQRAITPITNRLTDQERNLVDFAQRPIGHPDGGAGMTLTPAQQTGSKGLQTLEETMARTPLAAGPMRGAFEGQRGQFNTAVNERAGITANNANPETLDNAFRQQGQTFNDLAARTTVNLDQHAAQDIQRVAQDYGRRLNTDVAPVFQSYIDDLAPYLQGQGQYIPGDLYARMRSGITTTIRENQANPTLQRALGGIVEALDNAVERTIPGGLRQEWQEARRQYQALMTVDTAMRGGTNEARSRGDIAFGALTNAVRGSDREGYARGRGQMNELSRLGDYLAPKIPNSGTPERLMVQNLLTGGALMGAGAATGVGLPAAAAAAATPWAVSRLYNSPAGRAWLTNDVVQNRTSVPQALVQQLMQEGVQDASEGKSAQEKKRLLAQMLMRGNEQRAGR